MTLPHPVRVAFDGVDTAGKTTIANELAPLIIKRGRPVIRASIDGFHRPRAERRLRGAESPEGYYLDAFNYPALIGQLLKPLGVAGDLKYRVAVFDFKADAEVDTPVVRAEANAVLLFDGVFLLRPELDPFWDLRVFLDVSSDTVLARAVARDAALFGSESETVRRYKNRYMPGQEIYLNTVHPASLADWVIDNNDPANPAVVLQR